MPSSNLLKLRAGFSVQPSENYRAGNDGFGENSCGFTWQSVAPDSIAARSDYDWCARFSGSFLLVL